MDLVRKADIPIIGASVDQQAVKLLRDALALVEKGEAVGIGIVYQKKSGDIAIAFSPMGDRVKITGAAHLLARRLEDALIEG